MLSYVEEKELKGEIMRQLRTLHIAAFLSQPVLEARRATCSFPSTTNHFDIDIPPTNHLSTSALGSDPFYLLSWHIDDGIENSSWDNSKILAET